MATPRTKNLLPALALALCNIAQAQADQSPDMELLTGDTRLACEAILCLSTGERPSECQPAIRRYFSIVRRTSARHWRAARLPEPVPHGERGRLHAPVGQCTGGRLRPLRRRRTQWARLDARRWRQRVLHLQCNAGELPSLLRQRRPRRGFSPPDLCRPARARRPLG